MESLPTSQPYSPLNLDDYLGVFDNIKCSPSLRKEFLESLVHDETQKRKLVSTDGKVCFNDSKSSQMRAFKTSQPYKILNFEDSPDLKRKRGDSLSVTEHLTKKPMESGCYRHPYLEKMRSAERQNANIITTMSSNNQDKYTHEDQKDISMIKAEEVPDSDVIDLTMSPDAQQTENIKEQVDDDERTESSCCSDGSSPVYIPTHTPVGDEFKEDHYTDKDYYDDPVEFSRKRTGWSHLTTSGYMRGKTFEQSKFTLELYFEATLRPWLIERERDAQEILQDDEDDEDMMELTGVGGPVLSMK